MGIYTVMLAKGAKKGIFITTSSFTKEALSYTPRNETKIVLIDGNQLTQLMIDYNLGCTTQLKLGNETLEVVSNHDGSFTINNENGKICYLSPEIMMEGTVWTTANIITPNYVEQIEELIESHHL